MKKFICIVVLLLLGFFIGYMYTGSDLFNKDKVSHDINSIKNKIIEFFSYYEVKGFKE